MINGDTLIKKALPIILFATFGIYATVGALIAVIFGEIPVILIAYAIIRFVLNALPLIFYDWYFEQLKFRTLAMRHGQYIESNFIFDILNLIHLSNFSLRLILKILTMEHGRKN